MEDDKVKPVDQLFRESEGLQYELFPEYEYIKKKKKIRQIIKLITGSPCSDAT